MKSWSFFIFAFHNNVKLKMFISEIDIFWMYEAQIDRIFAVYIFVFYIQSSLT